MDLAQGLESTAHRHGFVAGLEDVLGGVGEGDTRIGHGQPGGGQALDSSYLDAHKGGDPGNGEQRPEALELVVHAPEVTLGGGQLLAGQWAGLVGRRSRCR